MDTHSYLISPNTQRRQEIRLVMLDSELKQLLEVLTDIKRDCLYWPKVAEELRFELRHALYQVRDFNASERDGGEP